MYKEFLAIIFIFIVLFFLLRFLYAHKPETFRIVSLSLVGLTLALNIFYNLKTFFPSFVLDNEAPLGDSKENLFLYKADSSFNCEVVFPVLDGRTVLLDNSDDFYELFINTFSKEASAIDISQTDRDHLAFHISDFDISAKLYIINMMNYAFPRHGEVAIIPSVYVQTQDLKGETTLVAVSDSDLNLYLMSEKYYRSICE